MEGILHAAAALLQRNIDLPTALAEASHCQSGADFLQLTFEDIVHLLREESVSLQQSPGALASELLWDSVRRALLLQRKQEPSSSSSSSSQQHRLQQEAQEDVMVLVSLAKQLQEALLFDLQVFTRAIMKDIQVIPLETLWILLRSGVVHLRHFMSEKVFQDRFIHLMASFPNCDGDEHMSSMLRGLSTSLVYLGFPEQSTGLLPLHSARDLLYNIITKSYSLGAYRPGHSTVLDVVAGTPHISQFAAQQALSGYLKLSLHSKPLSNIYSVVSEQDKYKLASLSENSAALFTKLAEFVVDSIPVLEHSMLKEELCWSAVLSFVACFLHIGSTGVQGITKLVSSFVKRGLAENECHLIHCSLVLARQAGLEGAHIFPSYRQWFKDTFGNSPSTVVASKKTLHLVVRSLTQLVPYEHSDCLKVHIMNPPRGLSNCKDLIADYVALAKTKLKDLKEPISEQSSSAAGGRETHMEELLAMNEARKAVEYFAKNQKIPEKVHEISMLRKPYFIRRFLPALLSPSLAVDGSARDSLVAKLGSKVPPHLLESYRAAMAARGVPADSTATPSPTSRSAELARVVLLLTRLRDTVTSNEGPSKLTKTMSKLSDAIASVIQRHNATATGCNVKIINLGSPGLEPWEVEIVDCLISTICEIVMLVYQSCEGGSGLHQEWLHCLVGMLSSHCAIHPALLVRLWELTHSKGPLLSPSHQLGLAVFCAELWQSQHQSFHPLRLVGSEIEELESCSSYAQCVLSGLQVNTALAMSTTVSFCCHFVQCLLAADIGQYPSLLLYKMHYLYSRFAFLEAPEKETGYCSTIESLLEVDAFRACWSTHQVPFACWLKWELAVEPAEDCLTPHRRSSYLRSMIFDHFLSASQPAREGGVIDTAAAFEQLFTTLLRGEKRCESYTEGIRQLQELSNVLPSSECCKPCLMQVLENVSKESGHFEEDVMQRCMGVVCSLPPFLIFCNSLSEGATPEHILQAATCISHLLVPNLGCHYILPSTLTLHIYQGAWSLDKATPTRPILHELITASHALQASLISHWGKLKALATSLMPALLPLERTQAWLIDPSSSVAPDVDAVVVGVCVFWKQLEGVSSNLPSLLGSHLLAQSSKEVMAVVLDCCARELLTVSSFSLRKCLRGSMEERLLVLAGRCLRSCPAAVLACSEHLDYCGDLQGLIEKSRNIFRSKGELRCLCIVLFQILHQLDESDFQQVARQPGFPALCVSSHAACMALNTTSHDSDPGPTQYEVLSLELIGWSTGVAGKTLASAPQPLRKEIESLCHHSLKTCCL